ncbi:NBS-LRR type resistance protein [Striga asiatica]|uniref:NBS-LRR type resistance protein n=2 Tax=Striga asiatica TaxID=4170 RepID=A0A5A7PN56_STRAF|nr:NBS-LRR type resistance protein [Striga asiatica]
MAYAAVVSLIQTLDQFPSDQFSSSHQEISLFKCLHTKAHTLLVLLQKKFQTGANELEAQIREVVYEAEDAVESHVSTRYLQPESVESSPAAAEIFTHKLQVLLQELESIEKRLTAIGSDRVDQRPEMTGPRSGPLVASTNKLLVGLENELSRLKGKLVGESSRLNVVAVVGMAGIGKTTLVDRAFHDPSIGRFFHYRAWANVGPGRDPREVIAELLGPTASKFSQESSYSQLTEFMFRNLKGRKYLIVLDGLTETEAWDDLKSLFPNDDNGSRVVLTTRLRKVALHASGSIRNIHETSFLGIEECWNLLRNIVFDGKECPPELIKVGKEIAENCHGLPLTIVLVGTMLFGAEKSLAYWERVADGPISAIYESNDVRLTSAMQLLNDDSMPQHLKAFFMYMGLLPSNHEIPASKLVRLWISEGFVEWSGPESPEDVAEERLEELFNRSLVLVHKRKSAGGIKTCSIHSAVWHLCVNAAEKDGFFCAVTRYTKGRKASLPTTARIGRRLCIRKNILLSIKDVNRAMLSVSKARSFLCSGRDHPYPLAVCSDFGLLRVLDVLSIRFYEFPTEILTLVQLRYLALTCSEIPPSLSELRNLQVLIMRRHTRIKASGAGPSYFQMWNMRRLRHLVVEGGDLPHPHGAVLMDLLTLSNVTSHSCGEDVLRGTPNLKKLGVCIEVSEHDHASDPSRVFDHLAILDRLESYARPSEPVHGRFQLTFPKGPDMPCQVSKSAAAAARRVTQASIVSSMAYTTFLICLSTSLTCVALFDLVDSGSSKVFKEMRSVASSQSSSSVSEPERRSSCDVSSHGTYARPSEPVHGRFQLIFPKGPDMPCQVSKSAAAAARRVTQASIVSSMAYTTFLICLSTSLTCVALFDLVDSGSSKVFKEMRSVASSQSSSSVSEPERRSSCDVSSHGTFVVANSYLSYVSPTEPVHGRFQLIFPKRPDELCQSAAAAARRVTQASIVSSMAYTTFLICLSTSLSRVALFDVDDSGSSKVLKEMRSFVSSRSSSSVSEPEKRSACDVSSRDTQALWVPSPNKLSNTIDRERMAYSAVTFLLENLSRLLTSHSDLISGAERELQGLKRELLSIKNLLKHDDSRPDNKTQLIRDVEMQIRGVVYEIEDTIDACLTRLSMAADTENMFGHSRGSVDPAPADLAQLVRSLRQDKLKPAMDELIRMGITRVKIAKPEKHEAKSKTAPRVRGNNIVGLEDEQARLMHLLTKESDDLDVIAIIGMPGLGKTTLARKVYETDEIQCAFPTRIWACVSKELNTRSLFLDILQEFTSKDMSGLSVDDLALTIHGTLETRRFLLVLDDVWTPEAWDTIREALPLRNASGKVLITSRFQIVGKHVSPVRPPYQLRFLTEEEGCQILRLKVFGQLQEWPRRLGDVGRRISTQCRGLPILLLMIAGILDDHLSTSNDLVAIIRTWEDLSKSLSGYVIDMMDVFTSVLALSYARMCDELRDCFLYLGVFPEDYEIPASTLTRLWIAEGFVQPRHGQSHEERAYENLMHLINRNLVMIDKLKSSGEVKICRVHDTVRDFCKVKAEGIQQFFQELRRRSDGAFELFSYSEGPQKNHHRRICVHYDVTGFFSPEPYLPNARSFLSFSTEEFALQTEDIPKVPAAFKLVRILHIMPLVFRIFPLGLTLLVHLKYVALSSDFKVLPEAVTKLINTQTLVPSHSEGNNLQTLANLSPENCTVDLFERTSSLKKLGIRGKLATHLDFDSLGRLRELDNLKLINDIHSISPSEGQLPCLPPPGKFPPRLRILTLSATLLGWEKMSVLGLLKNLEVLKLKDNAFVGPCWKVVEAGFPLLHFLLIEHTDLVSWKLAQGDYFPRLRCLTLRNCEELEALPDGLADIPRLEVMNLHRTSKMAVSSARKIQGDIRNLKLSIFPVDE